MSFCRLGFLVLLASSLVSCLEQYNPLPYWQKIAKEQETANRPIQTLKDDGTLPEKVVPVTDAVAGDPVEEKYNNFCASCHGADGKANTPAGQALTPHPRNFTDVAWQEKVTDEHIETVIRKGGAAVGLSPSMAPWEAMLPGDLPAKMVAKVRSFKGK